MKLKIEILKCISKLKFKKKGKKIVPLHLTRQIPELIEVKKLKEVLKCPAESL